ncbi:MAG: hypothetical protein IJ282_03710 [Lachnospiraceae bacterium]|nr:hypothetical protein [Lachnospiraceae bacterium]
MAENKKSATETTEKVMTKYDKKVQKRKEAELKAKKEKVKSRIISTAVVLVLIAVVAYFPIRKSIALSSAYIEIGENKVTELEFEYYYNMAVNTFVTENSYWLSYLGLDTTKDLAEQQYTEHITWDDYFQQTAVNNLSQVKALAKEGKEAGFEYDATADVELHNETMKTEAAANNMPVKNYVKVLYGEYATLKNIKDIVAESYYAVAYYDHLYDSQDVTDDEITAYYNENTKNFDSVDYKLITVEADLPEGEKTTDAEGKETTADPTDEQIAAAMEKAKAEADSKLAVIDTEGVLTKNAKYASVSGYYADWLFNEARKAGDTTVIENTSGNSYYVLKFENRYLDETKSVNVRVIATSTDMGATIKEEWNSTGANEDAFIALVEKYSEDTYTKTKGGLFENLTASSLSGELGAWLLDGARQAGDVEAIAVSGDYYYVVYYLGQGEAEWKSSIDATLRSADTEAYVTEITNAMEVVDTKGKLTYEEAYAAQESASAETSTEAAK